MNTPHQDFQKAKEELIDLLKHHEAVLAFQEAEESIGQIPQISDLAGQMKAYQQEAVLFQKIEKQRAYEEAGEQANFPTHAELNLPAHQPPHRHVVSRSFEKEPLLVDRPSSVQPDR